MKTIGLLFLTTLFFCCQNHVSTNRLSSDKSNERDTAITKDSIGEKKIENKSSIQKTENNCNDLLFSLVKGSSFNSEIKQFKFKVWVDEYLNETAILKITMRNTERQEDVVISWLKLDVANKKLSDITIDPNNPVELNYDSTLFRKVVEKCGF